MTAVDMVIWKQRAQCGREAADQRLRSNADALGVREELDMRLPPRSL